ncbi:MAG TPA: hypothetical protein VK121_06135 [Pseudogracilibacillus sp.]|nr:hypothetical protein [Pseudogracilibacillus sp.]
MDKLHIKDLICNKKTAFLCGNGFSINFDKSFGNIYENLYLAHKDVIYKSKYRVKSNSRFKKKCNENYHSILRHFRSLTESDLTRIFEDAVLFAESIRNNKQLIKEFRESGIISELTFGLSEYDPLNQICEISKSKGIQYINIEHWTILIYFYAVISKTKPEIYRFPNDNSFITALRQGNVSKVTFASGEFNKFHFYEDVIFNGFTIYFKMLFSIAIFSNGKAVYFDELDGIEGLDLRKLRKFLKSFDLLITLNYDKILEYVVDEKVERLHGEFVMNKEEFVYNQSFGMNYKNDYVSFSDILIGDYFIFKSALPVINKMSASRSFINKKVEAFGDKITRLIRESFISTVLLFGLNIENDQHVLRNLMLAFYDSNVENPNIIYSYFNKKEKQRFEEEFYKVITFSEEVNEYCKKIKISFIPTQDILSDHFHKTENQI